MHQADGIRRGMSAARTAAAVADDLYAALAQPDLSLVLIFASADQDLAALGPALAARFGDALVVGCTTAGEITPQGYTTGAVSGLSLGGPDFAAAIEVIDTLQTFNVGKGHDVVRNALQQVVRAAPQTRRERMFAVALIDGLSGCEEAVVSSLHAALGEIPLFGGSAGDCLRFQKTHVLHGGQFRSDCALLLMIATTRPFRVFKTEHFVAGLEKTVVTEADPAQRTVSELNAEPAAREYARLVGLEMDELTPMIFATHPVVVRVGGQNFVRSIQKVNDDGSLTFFCAIDEGIVLTAAHGVDLARNLEDLFTGLRSEMGLPDLVISFDCILRGLELDQKNIRGIVGDMLIDNHCIGFSTYGEQYQAMHVNQTFTGVAIGRRTAQ